MSEVEVWKPVLGLEKLYAVSSLGQIRRTAGGQGARIGHLMRPCIDSGGYRTTALSDDGRRLPVRFSVVVCAAFHGPRPEGMEVRHLDGNSLNDSASNLIWGTPKDNAADSRRHGTNVNANKTHCRRGHEFTPENTKVTSKGGRGCITCEREVGRIYAKGIYAAAKGKQVPRFEVDLSHDRIARLSDEWTVREVTRLANAIRSGWGLNRRDSMWLIEQLLRTVDPAAQEAVA